MHPDQLIGFAASYNSVDLAVWHRGELVVDAVFGEEPVDVASVQKSIVSVLVGIAVARGHLRLTDTVTSHLGDGWTGRDDVSSESSITVNHLLTMTSGLGNAFEFVAEPGTWWNYNLAVYPITKWVLTAAVGRPLADITSDWLSGTLEMADTTWVPRVWNDDMPAMLKPAFVYPDGSPMEGLVSTAADLARFGAAVMGGCLGLGVDDDYRRAMTSASQALNPAYGLLWWVNSGETYLSPGATSPVDGPLMDDVPADAFAALGAGDQCCVAMPSIDLVVARTGAAAGPPSAAGSAFVRELARNTVLVFGPDD